MAVSNVRQELIPPEENIEMEDQQAPEDTEEFEDVKLDKTFWQKVKDKVKISKLSWNRAMDEVRAEHFITRYGSKALFFIIYKWPQKYQEKSQFSHSFEYLISRMAEIILEQNETIDYGGRIEGESKLPGKPTLLHLAAEQDFLHVSRCLVDHYPGLLYLNTADEQDDLPVELALREKNDVTAAYLISQMRNKRVENLFLCSPDNEKPAKHYFGDIISFGMKKTVVAVLDKLINPHWPYLPENVEDDKDGEIQRALDCIPYDPMKYDFHYHILEADENGRQPKIKVVLKEEETSSKTTTSKTENEKRQKKYKIVENRLFNRKSVSCLQTIADSENKEAVKHPVVRMLVLKKWKEFAKIYFCVKAALYLVFLLMLSFALMYGSTREEPTQYINRADKLRAFCEIFSIILLMFQFLDEIGELARERRMYFKFWQNWADVFGIILTLLVIPLRFAQARSQWSLAALGYGFNFVRLLKYSDVSRTIGLYTTTFIAIIKKDITRFLMFFSVIFLGFCGAMFLALKGDEETLHSSYSNFPVLMLAGFRALVEQQPLEDNYDEFGWLTIIILLFYMGVVIVILLNVLIAQLSYTYSEAKKMAKLQYAADTMRIVTRLDRFLKWNFRVMYYERDGWVNDEDLAEEMLEYSEDRPPWETVEERVPIVREVMRRFVRKGKIKDPLESIDEKITQLTSVIEKSSDSRSTK